MHKNNRQPKQLIRGKVFHKKIQNDWLESAEGIVASEKNVEKKSGRKGRVDIFVNDESPDGTVAIVELKASDWDKMTDVAVRRNVRRQIRQIWGYIESQIVEGKYLSTGEGKDVSPGIIFPKRPKDLDRKKLIESLFFEEGIPVVWDD